jgi:hypothetical protein
MDILNNIVKKSLVKFPIPNRNHFISDIEMLDYFGNVIPNYDAHLGIDFCPKEESLPLSKYTSNGYCYIYLDGLNIIDREKYTNLYKRILLKAKKDGYRKFIISAYSNLFASSKQEDLTGKEAAIIPHMLSPFYPQQDIYFFSPEEKIMTKENAFVEGKYFRNKFFSKYNTVNFNYVQTYDIDFKIPYDSLIFRLSDVTKPYLFPFYCDPKVKIFYVIRSTEKNRKAIPFRVPIDENNSIVVRMDVEQKVFGKKRYKVFKDERFPPKYLPNV